MPPKIRLLTPEDLPYAQSLREIVGWNQTDRDWLRLISFNPQGCFLIECDGEPAGTVTTTVYGEELAWIGMMLVHPDHRRKGLATALMEHSLQYLLEERRIPCVKLDATPAGMAVYEKLGFQVESELARWEGQTIRGHVPESDGFSGSLLDQQAFGADRQDYLRVLSEQSAVTLVRGECFGMMRNGARAHYLGPLITDSAEVGSDLARELLESPEDRLVYWDIFSTNDAARTVAKRLGFQEQRALIRMWVGSTQTVENASLQWGISGPATG